MVALFTPIKFLSAIKTPSSFPVERASLSRSPGERSRALVTWVFIILCLLGIKSPATLPTAPATSSIFVPAAFTPDLATSNPASTPSFATVTPFLAPPTPINSAAKLANPPAASIVS